MICVDLNQNTEALPFSTAVALGNFDGLHNGHRELIRRAVQQERDYGLTSAVLLFRNHTREQDGIALLSSLEDKLEHLESMGISCVFLVDFDERFKNLTREAFVEDFLLHRMRAGVVIVGEDYRFGKAASGNVAFLMEEAKKYDFRLSIIPEVTYGDVRISSTRIRHALREGAVEWANDMLGDPYRIQGRIVPGAARGRRLGFRTANLEMEFPFQLPKKGVYLTSLQVRGE